MMYEKALEMLNEIEPLTEDHPTPGTANQDIEVHRAFNVIRNELLRREEACR
jgi:hypothetical protein